MPKTKTILFKRRSFGDYINDTFTFLKQEGKIFFKNFIQFFGGYLILFLFLIYVLVDLFYGSATSSNMTEIDVIIANNLIIAIVTMVAAVILSIYLSIMIFSYPVYYLKNMIDHPDTYQDPQFIKKQLKSTIRRGFSFILLTSILVTPIVLIAYGLASVLIFLIIGIPLLFLIGPYSASITSIAYYDYVTQKTPFFASYKQAFKLTGTDFWGNLGNSFIFIFIIQLLGYVSIMLPNTIYSMGIFISEVDAASLKQLGIDKVLIALFVLLSSAISITLYLVFLINQGIAYYSARESIESYQSMLDIETIGKNHE